MIELLAARSKVHVAMWVLATDVDGTLTGDRTALERLGELRNARNLYLVLSTGRRFEQVLDGMTDKGLPASDAVLRLVSTEINVSPLTERF